MSLELIIAIAVIAGVIALACWLIGQTALMAVAGIIAALAVMGIVYVEFFDDDSGNDTPAAEGELAQALTSLSGRLTSIEERLESGDSESTTTGGRVNTTRGEDDDNDDTKTNVNNDEPKRNTRSGGACQPGDKVGTWSEREEADASAAHRIEVGGHGLQHFDFYPEKGIKSISFGVGMIEDPEGIPDLGWGFGSIWEWNPPGCSFDLEADMAGYAEARLDSGHSGLIVQWGSWKILENLGTLSDEEAKELVELHRQAFENAEDSDGTNPFAQR